MSATELGYEYRPDGNFLVRCTCAYCGDDFDVHALANTDPLSRCPACRQVDEWWAASEK